MHLLLITIGLGMALEGLRLNSLICPRVLEGFGMIWGTDLAAKSGSVRQCGIARDGRVGAGGKGLFYVSPPDACEIRPSCLRN